MRRTSEPIFQVPPAVLVTLVLLGIVHAVRTLVLSQRGNIEFLLLFSFIPARYDEAALLAQFPGGFGAQIWTFVTYALIHADLTHLGLNAIWLLAFGSAVARRFGTVRFFVFFAISAVAGAAAHLLTHHGEFVPMVGASASISGYMGAAVRFAFQRQGPIELWRQNDPRNYRIPAQPLRAALADPRILAFLGVWFGLNLLLGIGSIAINGGDQEVAWQAHIGGFLTGLLLFSLFDPIPRRRSVNEAGADRGVTGREPGSMP